MMSAVSVVSAVFGLLFTAVFTVSVVSTVSVIFTVDGDRFWKKRFEKRKNIS